MESSVKYKPKYGRVLIKREIKEKTAGGIIIPDAKRYAICEGVIIGLGETAGITTVYDDDGNQTVKRVLNEGDTVRFGRHAGTWLDSTTSMKGEDNDDGTLFICQDEDILVVVNKEAA